MDSRYDNFVVGRWTHCHVMAVTFEADAVLVAGLVYDWTMVPLMIDAILELVQVLVMRRLHQVHLWESACADDGVLYCPSIADLVMGPTSQTT